MTAAAAAIHLDEPTVALAGDWHGNLGWVAQALSAIRRADASVRTVLHVGDFGLWPGDRYLDTVEYWAKRCNLRILVTPGNHDDWGQLAEPFARGELAHVSDRVTFLPRGYRFTVGEWSVLSFGGAASHDRAWRLRQRTKRPIWWADEVATDAELAAACTGGPADLLLTHDAASTMLPRVAAVTDRQAQHDDVVDADYVARSTAQITQLRAAAEPRLHVHGHMHVYDVGNVDNGTGRAAVRTLSLADEGNVGNIALLDVAELGARILSRDELRLPTY